jgi:ABC-type phosphate transport system auxiliary subunit
MVVIHGYGRAADFFGAGLELIRNIVGEIAREVDVCIGDLEEGVPLVEDVTKPLERENIKLARNIAVFGVESSGSVDEGARNEERSGIPVRPSSLERQDAAREFGNAF